MIRQVQGHSQWRTPSFLEKYIDEYIVQAEMNYETFKKGTGQTNNNFYYWNGDIPHCSMNYRDELKKLNKTLEKKKLSAIEMENEYCEKLFWFELNVVPKNSAWISGIQENAVFEINLKDQFHKFADEVTHLKEEVM